MAPPARDLSRLLPHLPINLKPSTTMESQQSVRPSTQPDPSIIEMPPPSDITSNDRQNALAKTAASASQRIVNHEKNANYPKSKDWNPHRVRKHPIKTNSKLLKNAVLNSRAQRSGLEHHMSKEMFARSEDWQDVNFQSPQIRTNTASKIADGRSTLGPSDEGKVAPIARMEMDMRFTLEPTENGEPARGSLLWFQENHHEAIVNHTQAEMDKGNAIEEKRSLKAQSGDQQGEPNFKFLLDSIVARDPHLYYDWLSSQAYCWFMKDARMNVSWEDWCTWFAPTVYELKVLSTLPIPPPAYRKPFVLPGPLPTVTEKQAKDGYKRLWRIMQRRKQGVEL